MLTYGQSNKRGEFAFTLAEVLITLGIIGVVAAMTIPTLMNKTQDMQFKETAKKAFSVSSQVISQIKQDNGGNFDEYMMNENSFEPVFKGYFKVIQDCNLDDCIPKAVPSPIYSALSGEGANTDIGGNGQFVTADGTFFSIWNPSYTPRIVIIVDVNGYQKKPNTYGRDIFFFQILNDVLVPQGATGTLWSGLCTKSSNQMQGAGCMVNVIQGINY